MSDDKPTPELPEDQPTERFDAIPPSESGDLPTERFDALSEPESYEATRMLPATPPSPGADRPTELIQRSGRPIPPASASAALAEARAEPKSRALMYSLIAAAAVLLVVIILVLVIQNTPTTGVPEATSTATAAPTATPVETPTTAPTPVESVAPPVPAGPVFDTFTAPESAGCVDGDVTRPLVFTWAGSKAQTAYIGIATTNAKTAPYESDLPTTFRYDNLTFDCTLASQVYTVTLEDAEGLLTHRTVTVLK